ncbi:MAG: hypothetical protein QXK78_01445 [Candidatus Bathyarchaeia archaeon]
MYLWICDMLRRPIGLLTLLMILILPYQQVLAVSVENVLVEVYRDGVAHIRMSLTINETDPMVEVQLLSQKPYNILALDEAGELLNYELSSSIITIYSLGASKVNLEYDADDLTSKVGEVWTVAFSSLYGVVLLLPEYATVIYFNNPPASVGSDGAKVRLELQPGSWEISYILEAVPPVKPPPNQPLIDWLSITSFVAVAVALAIAFAIAFRFSRRRRRLQKLRAEEAEVVRFLREHGGRALEAELREAFPQIPRTSMWRLIKRLEREGVLSVKKVGLQNVVELK